MEWKCIDWKIVLSGVVIVLIIAYLLTKAIKGILYGGRHLTRHETKPSKRAEKNKPQDIKDFEAGIVKDSLFDKETGHAYDLTNSWPLYLANADLTCLVDGQGRTANYWSPFLINQVFLGLQYWDNVAFYQLREEKIRNFLDRIQLEIIGHYDDGNLQMYIQNNKSYMFLRRKYPMKVPE